MNAAVHFIAQSISQRQVRTGLPSVLKIEVVGLASDPGLVELASDGCEISRSGDGVSGGRRGQQSGQRVGQIIARGDVMLAAGRWDRNWRVRRAAAERIRAIRSLAEDGRVAIDPNLDSPLKSVRAAYASHIVLALAEIAIRSEHRP